MTPDPGLRYPPGTNLLPRLDVPSAEWHLTYACDLECIGCNRASFLRKPHTPDMTLEDAEEFIRQARELQWAPMITIIGGEPTMHRDFEAFAKLAHGFSGHRTRLFSNGHRPAAREKCRMVNERYGITIMTDSFKRESVTKFTGTSGWVDDIYVSPSDYGEPLRQPCYSHASVLCGVSVDHEGYAPCAMGGMIDGILGLGVRTKRLADLFDVDKMAELTARLCAHCGHQRGKRENVDACEKRFDTPMSPTWIRAFEGRK